MKCIIDDSSSIKLMTSGNKPTDVGCDRITQNVGGGYSEHTNLIYYEWRYGVGAKNPFGNIQDAGTWAENSAYLQHGGMNWFKNNLSTRIGFGNYQCSNATNCELCSYDGVKIMCDKCFNKQYLNFKFDSGDSIKVSCTDSPDYNPPIDLRVILRTKEYSYFLINKAYK